MSSAENITQNTHTLSTPPRSQHELRGERDDDSHVRVILETSDSNTVDRMEYYLACEQRGMDPGRLPSDPEYAGGSSADDFVPQMCLFYYGYFVWI